MTNAQKEGWYDSIDDPRSDPEVMRMMEEDQRFYDEIGWPDDQSSRVVYVTHEQDSGSSPSGNHVSPSAVEASRLQAVVALADSITRLAESVAQQQVNLASRKIESPYLTKEEAAAYLRTTPDGIYGRVERGRLKPCPGVKEYIFTKEMLDDSMMGRVEKPAPRTRKRRGN